MRFREWFRSVLGRNRHGVRPNGPESFVIAIGPRSYWVHAQRLASDPPHVLVRTSDIRDITHSVTVVAAPPAPDAILPEVRRRLLEYFTTLATTVTFS